MPDTIDARTVEQSEAVLTSLASSTGGVLLIGDHASNHVPDDIDLGIDAKHFDQHIAIDIGIAGVADCLVAQFGFSSVQCNFSRLVADCNRRADEPQAVAETSDGVNIPGNVLSRNERNARLERFYWTYHHAVATVIRQIHPELLVFLHSFTPALTTKPDQLRPWHLGVMYDVDTRASEFATPLLEQAGFIVGDQLPYSGQVYNSSLDRHGEQTGTPYFGLEMRQDIIMTQPDQSKMAEKLGPIFQEITETLAR